MLQPTFHSTVMIKLVVNLNRICTERALIFHLLDIGKALSTLPSLSHALGEVILQGLAASHSVSNEEDRESM